ncbi:MAG: SDR family NAD(P)-dependent oxidoreductase [Alphaproteobacteria bacterium]
MAFSGETIWIIGASSGIGAQLARNLSKQDAHLILSARSQDKLDRLNDELGGEHTVIAFDISDFVQVKNAIDHAKTLHSQIDRIICMAGIYEPKAVLDMKEEDIRNIIDVNLTGVIYFTQCAIKAVRSQRKAQIVACASVAGYVGLPNGQPYSASKAGLINFMQSLYLEAENHIDIKMICPGFVETPLTEKNNFDMPFIMSAEGAAHEIEKGLLSKKFEIHFPKKLTRSLKIISILPNALKFMICAKFKT